MPKTTWQKIKFVTFKFTQKLITHELNLKYTGSSFLGMGLCSQTNQLFHQQNDLHCQHRQTTTECSGWHYTGTIRSFFFFFLNIYKYINVHCSWAWLLLAIDDFGTKCTLSHSTTDPSSDNFWYSEDHASWYILITDGTPWPR
jgi:hypothetical protein